LTRECGVGVGVAKMELNAEKKNLGRQEDERQKSFLK
jgi:hypothetical protein